MMMSRLGNKKVVLVLSLILLLLLSTAGTLSYIFAETPLLTNGFQPSHVSCAVVETVNGTEQVKVNGVTEQVASKTNVKIQNTGDTTAYIRVAIVVTWKKDANTVYAQAPVKDQDYMMTFAADTGWLERADGFYYYTEAVAPAAQCAHADETEFCGNCVTAVLIEKCEQTSSANVPTGYYLSVEIVASAIQATPDTVVAAEWSNDKVTVTAENGELTVTNKEADA